MRNLLLIALALVLNTASFAQVSCNASISASVSGSTATVTNSSTPVATTNITTRYLYVWNDGNYTNVTTNASQSHLYLKGGTYSIRMIQFVDDSSTVIPTYCHDSMDVTVTVPGVPCATNISHNITSNNVFNFTAQNLNNTPNMTYSWSFGDGGTATGSPVTHQYLSPGTYTVTLVSTNGTCTFTQTKSVVVTGTAKCGVGVSGTYITNETRQFTAINTNNAPNMTYSWSFGDGNTATGTTVTHTYAAPGLYTVRVIGTNGSCSDTAYRYPNVAAPANIIQGILFGDSTAQWDTFTVWLIEYDSTTTTLSAVDSVGAATYSGTGGQFYFYNHPAGTYRLKAARHNGPTSGTGLVPTYHTSSLIWSSATLVQHNGGTTSGKDIYMQTGTLTAGPGFVSGNVNQGANKGSANGIPGMTVLLMDMSGKAIQYSVTDANGYYSFNNIPDGSYNVYPEDLGINTTAAAITIALGSVTHTDVHFERSLSKKTIVPVSVGIANINNEKLEYSIYPNPTKESVTIGWNATSADKAQVSIADVSGKVVYNGVATMSGATTINVSNLQSGLYFLNISSDMGNSTQKLIIK